MKKPIIAIDIDDTLFDHFRDLMKWYNRLYGTSLTMADHHQSSTAAWGTDTVEEAVRRVHGFYDTPEFLLAKPFDEAVEVMTELSREYELVIVTGRDLMLEEFTHEWLREHFSGLYKEVHLTAMYNLEGKTRLKVDLCQEIGAKYIIDDLLKTCLRTAEAGIKTILFGDYPWSKGEAGHPNLTRCADWQAVRRYFENEQRLQEEN